MAELQTAYRSSVPDREQLTQLGRDALLEAQSIDLDDDAQRREDAEHNQAGSQYLQGQLMAHEATQGARQLGEGAFAPTDAKVPRRYRRHSEK